MQHYRGDQDKGITAPNLGLDVTFAEHVVKARGRKSNYTSVSENRAAAQIFGKVYTLDEIGLRNDGHQLFCSISIQKSLQDTIKSGGPQAQLALRAVPRVAKNSECLIKWDFKIPSKFTGGSLISWTYNTIQKYFK